MEDKRIWALTESGNFSISSAWDKVRVKRAVAIQVFSVADLLVSKNLMVVVARSPTSIILEITWKYPDLGCFKLNKDCCSLGNLGRTGAGGIIRNDRGLPLGCFGKFEGIGTIFFAEFATLFVGLQMAQDNGIDSLLIECDSLAI
ncbi:uncharacterized protein LOC122067958, partial [Macadamia integrifolia]|uniref:uncharacterized protein LOC122067958 n=1 Tax=Macadamia integrifolia TaxID=60698 RepID=UPI001C4E7E8F